MCFHRACMLTLLLIGAAGAAFAADYYVAPSGSDSAPGSSARPFRTIGRGAEAAHPGDTVHVRGGVYRECVRPPRSGEAGKPISYTAEGPAAVIVNGASAISTPWKQAAPSLYVTDWPGEYRSLNNQSDAVFVDGQMVNLARWPEESHHDLSHPRESRIAANLKSVRTELKAVGPGYDIYDTTFTDPEFNEPDGRWKGAKVWVCGGGATDTQDGDGVTGDVVDTNQAAHTITVRAPISGPIGSANVASAKNYQFGPGSHYYLFDPPTPAGLLYPGEFWHDRANKKLYLRMAAGVSPAGHLVEVKARDYGFLLDPDGAGRSYITVKGFRLFACSITTDLKLGNGAGNGGNRTGVGPSRHILLDGIDAQYVCHFTDLGGNVQTQWGQSSGIIVSGEDCEIRNSKIAWSAGSGICVTGRRCRAINNVVHDVVYMATDCGGISTGAQYSGSDSLDNEIGYNTIYNVGIDGIEITSLKNSDPNRPGVARVHHNHIHHCVLQVADSAAIHEFGHDGQWARVDHNVIHDIGSIPNGYLYSGIYLDYAPNEGNAPGRYLFDHNVIYNVSLPLEINHPNSMVIINNTIIDVAKHGPIQSNGGPFTGVIVRNNVGNNPFAGVPDAQAHDHNFVMAADSLFADATNPDLAQRNYQLTAAGAQSAGQGGPTCLSGQKPTYMGAYEPGAPRWKAGYQAGGAPPAEPALPGLMPVGPWRIGQNALPHGDFEHLDLAGAPIGWYWTPFGNVSLQADEKGNHTLHIDHKQADRALQAISRMDLNPAWKRIRVSARMRGSQIVPGASGLAAQLVTRVADASDKMLGYGPTLALKADSDWTTMTEEFDLPAGADHLNIEVGNLGTGGDLWIDDIAYVPVK